MTSDFPAEPAGQDDEFERLWHRIAQGFKDVPPHELDAEIDRAVEELQVERRRAKTCDRATQDVSS